ncbi:response regulator [Imbroritus primus]|uniref:Response regulator n=2 Tax=Imbroritus primus TaxID=3058603 RepID=A0ACD3SMF1_9BURK|nr:response regulator [Burkholderiaceae bacterium PBA]
MPQQSQCTEAQKVSIQGNPFENQLERSRFAIKWGGILGAGCHPVYYLVWTYLLPQPYDNPWLRLSAAALCIPLIYQDKWTGPARRFLLPYWYFCLVYVLPFVCTYLTVRNDFSMMWMMTEVMMIFIMAICINIPSLLLGCVGIGMFLGAMAAIITAPAPVTLDASHKAGIALLPVIMLCSMVFSYAINKIHEQRNRSLRALAGSIAHEMRNPLAQVKYSLDSIGHMLPAPSAEDRSRTIESPQMTHLYRHLSQGQVAIERGLQVIAMTLDEVKAKPIDASRFTYLHAGKTVRKAVDEYSFETEEERRKVTIDIRREFLFKGDETILIFVLFNLIKNALHYFKSHPRATVTLTVDANCIRVRDTGPGISRNVSRKLFEPFQTSGKIGGTGLGLSYCKRAMQSFGGDIHCESKIGAYTEFVLRFPIIDEAEFKTYEATLMEAAKPTLQKKRILIVDDEARLRQASCDVLRRLGAEVDEAENGQAALEKLHAEHFDLVLMDLNMPVLDGYSATERIRASDDARYRNIPIIAYTTESAYMATVKTQKVGMNGFIEKPFRPAELVQVLQHALQTAAHQATKCDTSVLAGKRVLVMDDEPLNLSITTTHLKRWHVETVTASHGQAALDALSNGLQVDAILLDLNMPGMDGIEVASTLRTMPGKPSTMPILALTGYSDDDKLQAALTAGINACLIKPIGAAQLAQCLAQTLIPDTTTGLSISTTETSPVQPPQETITDVSQIPGIELFDLGKLSELVTYNGIDEVLLLRDRIAELLVDIEMGNKEQDIERIHNGMHSLISMAGHAGANALIALTRQHYFDLPPSIGPMGF